MFIKSQKVLTTFKRYTGFTLAETLLTLAVVGVVAAMSIPSLIADTDEAKYKASWKKAYSQLAQVIKIIAVENGGQVPVITYGQPGSSGEKTKAFLFEVANKIGGYNKYCYTDANCSLNTCYQPTEVKGGDGTLQDACGVAHIEVTGGWVHEVIVYNGMYMSVMTNMGASRFDSSVYPYFIDPVGRISIDVNGPSAGPNRVGKDVFTIYFNQTGEIVPAYNDNDARFSCNKAWGINCARDMLLN